VRGPKLIRPTGTPQGRLRRERSGRISGRRGPVGDLVAGGPTEVRHLAGHFLPLPASAALRRVHSPLFPSRVPAPKNPAAGIARASSVAAGTVATS